MRKILQIVLVAVCSLSFCYGQVYRKIFFQDQTVQSKNITIKIDDAVATPQGIKFKLSITNLSDSYIIFKPNESVFKIKGVDYKPDEKPIIIRPNDKDYKVVNLQGSNYMIAENYDFIVDGLYSIAKDTKGVNAPDFKLPASDNTFKAGDFTLTLEKMKKVTERTDARFKIGYNGNKTAFFEPNRVYMKMPDGQEFVNYHSDKNPLLFAGGDLSAFTAAWKDIPNASGNMQKDDMIVIWKNALVEANPIKMESQKITILFDKQTTEAKGR